MKLLVVGLGSIGQRHVRCLRQLYGAELELIAFRQRGLNLEVTPDLKARADVSLEELYGIRSFYQLDQALAENPVAALICTPNHLHVPIAIELAEAGLDLFLEKPVSHSLEGIEQLQRALTERQRICCVGYQLRFHPGIQRMMEQVQSGELGMIFGAHFDFGEHMPFWHRYEDYSETFMAREAEGGGVTLTQIHDIDIVYALFGLPTTAYASGGSTQTLKMDAEDHVSSVLTYKSSDFATTVTLTHDCLRYPPRRSYQIHGTLGSLRFDGYRNHLRYIPFDSETEMIQEYRSVTRNDLFVRQMQHFLACVRRETTPRVSLQDGVNSLKIALAIKESLRCSSQVEIAT